MRARPLVRAEDLAARFEVSVRTIYRDIAHLQASGLPIEGEPGVGYLLRPGFDLPSLTFTHDQLEALALGLAFVEGSNDPTLAAAACEARAKIQAGLPSPEDRRLADAPFFSLTPKQPAPPHADALRRAIRERVVIEIAYETGEGARSTRRLRPLAIWRLTDGWMVTAWCELRAAFRTFRLDRIASLTLTDERFEAEDETGLRTFLLSEGCEAPPV